MVSIDFIVLTKNNLPELKKTLLSLSFSTEKFFINILIFDGSSTRLPFSFLAEFLGEYSERICYFWVPEISGIYPSMNFALGRVSSDWFMFINSGDFIHPLFYIDKYYSFFASDSSVIFGQAEVRSVDASISWLVPDSRISSMPNWLRFFEPNHQAMFVRRHLANCYAFDLCSPIGADAYWKRQLLKHHDYTYIQHPFSIFTLGGVSTTYSLELLRIKISERNRSFGSRGMEIVKYLLSKAGLMSPVLQSLRSRIFGFLL